MKRSEIVDYIVINQSKVGLDLNPFESRDTIEKILKLAEEAGMLPPRTGLKQLRYIQDNAWEPEDDS